MTTVKDRIREVITKLEQVQSEDRHMTKTEKMEFKAELLSIAKQRIKELRGQK